MSTINTDRFQETKNLISERQQQKPTISHATGKDEFIRKVKEAKSGTRVPVPVEYINLAKNKRLESISESDPEFLQLVESIKEVGILQSPLITVIDNEIVPLMGHRRITAARFLNHPHVVCEIKYFTEAQKNTLSSLIENTARKNWNIIAVAKSLKELHEQGYEINKLADLLGKERQTIGRLLKVANWSDEILDLIQNNPEKLKMMSVLSIASRVLSEQEVLEKLNGILGINKNDTKAMKYGKNKERALNFVQKKALSESQKELIFEVLAEFGFLPKNIT